MGATTEATAHRTPTDRPHTAVVIPAAGQGRRFGSDENKIWAEISGRTVLARTVAVFNAHPAIDAIVIVAGADEVGRVQQAVSDFPKVQEIVTGGTTRAASVKNGLDVLTEDIDIVLVHDAARPLVSAQVIDTIIAGVVRVGAAIPGLPLSDTVKRVDGWGIVRATIPRVLDLDGEAHSGLTAVQTPQGARLALLRTAYGAFPFERATPTDEAALLEYAGMPVLVIPGTQTNIKITLPEDITLAERLLQESREPGTGSREQGVGSRERSTRRSIGEFRTGFGYDVHAFAAPEADRKLFLGGVEIPHDQGLEGHSDADVLLHAVCDAILGAASLGDIGILFPNTEEAYRGISSLRLLEVVHARLGEAGWQIVNIDATVVAEAPKLMPYRLEIQRTIAACLKIEPDRVSVKATTSEKMGFVGRREGLACWAVATVKNI